MTRLRHRPSPQQDVLEAARVPSRVLYSRRYDDWGWTDEAARISRRARRYGGEWTKEDLRELKNHSREKTPAKTIAKLTKRTVGALRQKAFILGLPLGRSSREWTKEDLRELKRYARQKPPATTIAKFAKSMRRTVAAVKRKASRHGLLVGHRR